jgi:hypothetical protein
MAVLLLLFFGSGILFMPRYNYAVISSQVAALGGRTAALETGFEKLNILAGPGEEKRAAVLVNLDLIALKMKKVDEDLVSYLENSAQESFRLDDALRRLGRIEDHLGSRYAPPEPSSSQEKASAGMSKADGSEVAKTLGLTPRKFAEMGFEEFLALALERGLTTSGTAQDKERSSGGLPAEAKPLFESFRTSILSINQSENLFVHELVERATRTGDYVEEDKSEPGKRTKPLQAPSEGGTVFVKNLEGGRRRVFHLSAEEHPEFALFEKLRDRALNGFLVLMSTLPEK